MALSSPESIIPLAPAPVRLLITPSGHRVACYGVDLNLVPADFFADPDGRWTYEELVEAAGFSLQAGVAVGALTQDFFGHPEGSAVVTLNAEARPYVAIVECPIAYVCTEASEQRSTSAA